MMNSAVLNTLRRALRSLAVQLPYHTVMHPVRHRLQRNYQFVPMAQRDMGPAETTKTNSKPYADLQVSGSLNEEGILGWTQKRGKLRMDYNSSEGSLLIPENGFYVIYLQVSYRSIENMDCSSKQQQMGSSKFLSHEIRTLSKKYSFHPQPIIAALETVSCKEEPWWKTMHSNARVYLDKGEKLQVKLSPKTFKLLDMGGKPWTKTFWGVYLDSNVN
ncbi:lymphotoxin-alpha-like isoform X2 [Clupea harengus]|uniref:Lymphotoxin-alpha-like isoform X2 n=1 Tax=Clupea harengus TaxID=7950 RepID=A0A6P8FDX2_CLUHA|nr:lymphotoxin-alpha-like isoform X2 [Clupea harengus]